MTRIIIIIIIIIILTLASHAGDARSLLGLAWKMVDYYDVYIGLYWTLAASTVAWPSQAVWDKIS